MAAAVEPYLESETVEDLDGARFKKVTAAYKVHHVLSPRVSRDLRNRYFRRPLASQKHASK